MPATQVDRTGPQGGRLIAALDAGLDRVNVSIHGWNPAAFARRGGTPRLRARRQAVLELLAARGLEPKLNYVYTGPGDDADLAALGQALLGVQAVLSVLDDLSDPCGSPARIREVVERLLGPWQREEIAADPHSLPATCLRYADGRRVELKSAHLGEHAPWRMCPTCPARAACREGTFALRLTLDGRVMPCMHRPDLALDLAGPARAGAVTAAGALEAWLGEVSR